MGNLYLLREGRLICFDWIFLVILDLDFVDIGSWLGRLFDGGGIDRRGERVLGWYLEMVSV